MCVLQQPTFMIKMNVAMGRSINDEDLGSVELLEALNEAVKHTQGYMDCDDGDGKMPKQPECEARKGQPNIRMAEQNGGRDALDDADQRALNHEMQCASQNGS